MFTWLNRQTSEHTKLCWCARIVQRMLCVERQRGAQCPTQFAFVNNNENSMCGMDYKMCCV